MIDFEAVHDYLGRVQPRSEGLCAEMEAYGREIGFPCVGPLVGRLLAFLTLTIGGRRVFECGSGFGYSALWFARAVGPGGEVHCTDTSRELADRAEEFLGRAGVWDRVRFHVGEARETLRNAPGPFDVILVDIDKKDYPSTLALTVPKLRSGGLLVTDNLLWDGDVLREEPEHEWTAAIHEYTRLLFDHPELETVIVPLRDGVAVSRRT
ncbi:MAG: O-methyltransferase [Planctomycetota bacterium]